ncbi:MAG: hypothetical protein QM765_21630 [Myxococcales bacterium]
MLPGSSAPEPTSRSSRSGCQGRPGIHGERSVTLSLLLDRITKETGHAADEVR